MAERQDPNDPHSWRNYYTPVVDPDLPSRQVRRRQAILRAKATRYGLSKARKKALQTEGRAGNRWIGLDVAPPPTRPPGGTLGKLYICRGFHV